MEMITVLKAGAAALSQKENIRKIIVIIVAAITTPILLFSLLFMQIMSAFEADGVLKSAQHMKGEDTAVHRSLQAVMEPYYENLYVKMEEEREKTIDRYTISYEVPVKKEEKKKEEEKTEEPEMETIVIKPTVMRKLNYIPENLIIAYLLLSGGIETETAEINGQMVWQFLDRITSIEESVEEREGVKTYWIENKFWNIQEIADYYFDKETERNRFLITSDAYEVYFDAARSKIIDGSGEEIYVGTVLECLSAVPLYLQYDANWGNKTYGDGTIKRNGCCPTCLAMVFSYFSGKEIYPDEIAAWAGRRYYLAGAGTSWEIFSPAARNWNVNCSNIGKNQTEMIQALSEGKVIIASMGPGTFTKGGHFIVLSGITEEGKLKVNDPNDNNVKRHAERAFEISLILRESKNMWVFG